MFDLTTLSLYRFTGKSEQAVREEWITPLLVHLGYGIGTLNDVRYEDQLRLAAPFRRLGRDRIKVDYRPTVLGHGLWIIEAKGHGRDDWDEAISQAWLYATHPEVDVPFMAIADGSRIAVYDVYKHDWDDPEVNIETSTLPRCFTKLASVLGAAHVTRAVRDRRLRHIGAAMRAELSLSRLHDYRSDMERLVKAAEPAVIENQRSVLQHQRELEDRQRIDAVADHGLFAVGVWANQPFSLNLQPARIAIDHLKTVSPAARASELDQLVAATIYQTGTNGSPQPRMFWMLRITALFIYLAMREDPAVGRLAEAHSRKAIRDHIMVFPDDPLARAAHRYERVLPVFVLRTLLTESAPDLSARARAIQETWSDERRLRVGLHRDRLLTDIVSKAATRAWTTMPWTVEALNTASQALEAAIPQLDYRTDRGRGPAADPYLEWHLQRDQLQLRTLHHVDQLGDAIQPDLLDADSRAELMRIVAADPDQARMREPAQRILERLGR